MAYNPVAQLEHEARSNGSNASGSPQPPNDFSFGPLSMDFDNLGGTSFMNNAKMGDESDSTRLGSLMRSLASTTSYDMVEDHDDYESPEVVDGNNVGKDTTQNRRNADGKGQMRHSSPEPVVRTTSMGPPLPLRHPTPDLQSLQGAYVGNVERLEQSAERLSMTSDIGEGIRKLKMEERRPEGESSTPLPTTEPAQHSPVARQLSVGSVTNSIIGVNNAARSGGYSPGGYISSPKGSFRSASWSHQSTRQRTGSKTSRLPSFPEPEKEGRPLDSPLTSNVPIIAPPIPPYQQAYRNDESPPANLDPPFVPDPTYNPEDRPTTSASTNTYQQATTLFTDFDGVHYTPRAHENISRQVSLNRPPLASGSEPLEQPMVDESMVYYPAPVPMMLNLPQRLSKLPSALERERRRTQLLNSVPADARKSAAWLSGVPELDENERPKGRKSLNPSSGNLAAIPPQLRASAFFDQPAAKQEVEVKHSSAVATLDSILDASAHAPVSAFTDHPIVGQMGAEVYGKANRKNALHDNKRKPRSSVDVLRSKDNSSIPQAIRSRPDEESGFLSEADVANISGEGTLLRQSQDVDRGDEMIQPDDEGQEESEEEEEEEPEDDEQYIGPPTTLLAELQLRKQQQKQRNRTAATAFPNGMHSTLLELDAVAQVQKQSRKFKQITLAWEDPDISADQDDEDVPLGMLFPSKKAREENQPLGLMEKRDLEDNEPLSSRRARLRGDVPLARNPSPVKRASTMYTLEVPGLTDRNGDEDGNETLAQRIRRLKAQGGTATGLGNDFTSEVMSQLGVPGEAAGPKSKTPDAEETLGQRRKRLQAEAKSRDVSGGSGNSPTQKTQMSTMANVLQRAAGARKPSNERITTLKAQMQPQMPQYNQAAQQPFSQQYPHAPAGGAAFGAVSGIPSYPSFGSTPFANSVGYSPMMFGQMGMNGYGMPPGYMDPMMGQGELALDPKQRDMIDRWRQSVMQ
jgi:hypothetical protein